MNPAQLISRFDRISDAPDAIPRLRRFILDLAMRGKLVEQDPRDEPASELLRRIQAENCQLEVAPNPLVEAEQPFTIPQSWVWIRIGDAAYVEMGQSPPSENYNQTGNGIPFYQGKTDFGLRFPTPRYWCTQPSKLAQNDDILISVRAPVGPTNVASEECCIGRGLAALRPHTGVYLEFLLYSLKGLESAIAAMGYGTTFVAITKKQLVSFTIPLPPLAEQHRIVAKIDELMALCDRLEAAQAERENRRDRLVASSLHRLNDSADADAFHDHARFYFNHLPRLTTRTEHIQQLRQTILNLAVRGKLVPQDPNDEPAAVLLKHIQTEKARLLKEGKIKSSMPLLELAEKTMPFRLPTNWRWVHFGELIIDADAGWSPKSEGFPRTADNWGVLKVSAVSWDKFLPEENKQLLPGVIPPKSAQVRSGDFLISRANTSELVAKCVVVGDEPRNLILSDKIVRLHISPICDKKFLCIVNNHAEHARSYYAEEASGTSLSMKNVSRAVIYALVVPLPPLAEQQRIVAKVDELMALCDKLETQLTTTYTDSRRLLDAVLHEALAPAGQQ